jgi:hypothetical protein
MELPVINFELTEVARLYATAPQIVVDNKIVRDMSHCEAYVKQYFYPTKRGCHYMWDSGQFLYFSKEEARDVWFARMPKEISQWYFKGYYTLFDIINKLDKPRVIIQDRVSQINLCPGVLHKKKAYNLYSQEIKSKVKIFLDYMLDVACSGDKKCHSYVIKWYANVCQGKKNCTALYWKGPQRIGK